MPRSSCEWALDPRHVGLEAYAARLSFDVVLGEPLLPHGRVPLKPVVSARGMSLDKLRDGIERDVRYANITIIEGNGGRIWAESVVGVGSTFFFMVPS